jgi:hypothetical protein
MKGGEKTLIISFFSNEKNMYILSLQFESSF